jgi:hypothetical protein
MANVLDLTIDATGMERGAQQAQQALNKVTQSVKLTDQALNKAFQTTGGTIQVAGGISQTAKALADLNAASAASSAARTLLEIGRTAQDFRELSQGIQQSAATYDIYGTKITTAAAATGRLQSVMMTLGAVVRANPLLAIATAIGAISTAMSVFGDNTKKAADAYGELGAEMRKVRATEAAAEYLGINADTGAQRRALLMRTAEQAMGRGMSMQELQASGMGMDAMRFLASRGNQQALDYMRQGGSYTTRSYAAGMQGVTVRQFERGRMPDVGLNAAQTQEFLRARARETGMVPTPAQSFSTGQNYGIGGALNQSMQMAMLSAEYKRKEAEDSQRVKDNMARAADYAANIGATVGSAFADVLMKTTTLRQAFASIVASIARQGLSDVGAAIFRGAVSGLTPTQAGGNAGLTAPGTTPRN